MNDEIKSGYLYGFIAFFTWGLVPIFWKYLHHIGFLEVLAHRIVWASLILLIYLIQQNKLKLALSYLTNKRKIAYLVGTTILIFFNWNLFIWAVDKNFIVECSLGYFINPLINVFLGVLLLNERLKTYQWAAVFLAFLGISSLLISQSGRVDISLGLAVSFGLYGLLKKKGKLDPLMTLFLETVGLAPFALYYFFHLQKSGSFMFLNSTNLDRSLLILAGFVTVVPLLYFSKAIEKLPLSTVGLMQYMTPTMQLLVGVFMFNEKFTKAHGLAFGFIWSGLLLYTLGSKIFKINQYDKRV